MIILHEHKKTPIRAAIFDFDGTISTLRYGWETVMAPLMIEYIAGDNKDILHEVEQLVDSYIDESTGIQTIHQMKWFNETIKKYNNSPGAPDDPWFYKEEYNRRLMLEVAKRRDDVISGNVPRENYIMGGAEAFLAALKEQGVLLYAASGTDEADVIKEAGALGFAHFFESIQGAKPMAEDCSKDAVIRSLIENSGFAGGELLVVGDGKVEIMLGREAGALTLGLASDEEKRVGFNPTKEKRLVGAGAHAIVGDFTDLEGILNWI